MALIAMQVKTWQAGESCDQGRQHTWLLPPCQQSLCSAGGSMSKVQQCHVLQSDLCVRGLGAELHLCSELLQITGSHPLCLPFRGAVGQDDTG